MYRFDKETESVIASRYQSGETTRALAAEYGCGKETVRAMAKRADKGRSPKHIDEDVQKAIVARYEAGELGPALAKEYGCCRETVLDIIRRNGGKVRSPGAVSKLLDGDILSEVIQRYKNGDSQVKIAGAFGISQSSLRRALILHGVELREHYAKSGEEHQSWQGGRTRHGSGYWMIKCPLNSPFASMRNLQGYIPEHRFVMAQHLGRSLLKSEQVHHINGDRTDNRLENLQLRITHHGAGAAFCCADCGSKNIVPDLLAGD